jgi:hypothetical protein
MVTYNQQMEAEGTRFAVDARKRGSLSGPVPLFTLFLFALALSIVFPYGLGIAIFAWVIALAGALFGVGFASYLLLKELLGKTTSFGYAPTAAYLSGKKMKKTRTTGSSDEEKDDR